MFGLGFGEILLIAVVALVVLGPERLPKVAHSAGLWIGRIQNYINNVKSEINQQAGMAEFKRARDSFELAARSIESDLRTNLGKVNEELDSLDRAMVTNNQSHSSSEPFLSYQSKYERCLSEISPIHRVSLRRQALQRKRDMRPKHRLMSKLRVRRH